MKRHIPFFDVFLILLVLIITTVSFLSFSRINDLISSSEWVNKSNSVVLKIEQVISLVKDTETSQRGFLLTRDSSFLRPYFTALPRIPVLMRELDSLTRDDEGQNEKLKKLNRLLTLKAIHVKRLIGTPVIASDMQVVLIRGKTLMDSIRYQAAEMEENEQRLLSERTRIRDHYISFTPSFSLFLILFTLLIVILSFFKIRKDKSDIFKKNEELLSIKTYLQAILDSSSDIILTFDEKLNYTSINNAGERYLNKVRHELIGKNPFDMYPQARDSTQHQLMMKALEGETNQINIASVLDPAFKIQTTFIPLLIDGKIVGILNIAKDITSLEKANETIVRTNELLELKNAELEEANNSLTSFNYIASHDLKEPLRKIQTFSKLLVDAESSRLSGDSKYYFERIVDSAARMQTLIEALLNFSKAQANKIDFKPTNLNTILDDLKKEFAEPLAAKHGNLEYKDLPTILAVPHLINQLFENLIGNSIKYSRKDQDLSIQVACEKVHEIYTQNRVIKQDYWKISVKDNGIGFNQQYAEKVFELFQRLHGNAKLYEGTGIGLTICKKIVQNHQGYIYAESIVDKGSTFTILLPANI